MQNINRKTIGFNQRGAALVEAAFVIPFLGLIIFGFTSLAFGMIKMFVVQQAAYGSVLMGAELKKGGETTIEERARTIMALMPKYLKDTRSNTETRIHSEIQDAPSERLVSLRVGTNLQGLVPMMNGASVGGSLVAPMLSPRETIVTDMTKFANPPVLFGCAELGAENPKIRCYVPPDPNRGPIFCKNEHTLCLPDSQT